MMKTCLLVLLLVAGTVAGRSLSEVSSASATSVGNGNAVADAKNGGTAVANADASKGGTANSVAVADNNVVVSNAVSPGPGKSAECYANPPPTVSAFCYNGKLAYLVGEFPKTPFYLAPKDATTSVCLVPGGTTEGAKFTVGTCSGPAVFTYDPKTKIVSLSSAPTYCLSYNPATPYLQVTTKCAGNPYAQFEWYNGGLKAGNGCLDTVASGATQYGVLKSCPAAPTSFKALPVS